MKQLNKILIANRGEIAVRVIHTARSLGYRTVAVYSTADVDALHVLEADEAVCIGPANVSESYLLADKILAAAQQTQADAIHPGYGFLSENADFCQACERAGITFIGPDAKAIELMGSKRLSKIAMIAAGVPCIPGYQGAEQDESVLSAEATRIGFPLMVKASAGGGGRGMRLVQEAGELAAQIKTARSEAQSAFGDGELILERAVLQPRHIEIQVFADAHGNAVYLGERDCSIQRRHQKVVEEAPSPFVDEALRQRMGKAAVDAALSCHYRGAGTVEFLVDKDKNFYFLEMNTRLQVEHPVTELITGQDLVAWQFLVAAGEPLPLQQQQISLRGHAMEVRLYAENPRHDFLPQTGQILLWKLPRAGNSDTEQTPRDGIRIDHGLQQGQVVSSHYDPMLAKVIAFGETRDIAARRLASALQDTQLLGVNTNKHFLEKVLRHPAFLAGEATTAFIEQHFSNDSNGIEQTEPKAASLALAAALFYQADNAGAATANYRWRSAASHYYHFKLEFDGNPFAIRLVNNGDHYRINVAESTSELPASEVRSIELTLKLAELNQAVLVIDGVRRVIQFAFAQGALYLDDGSGHYKFDNITQRPAVAAGGAGSGQIKASMDGAIVDVLVSAGDRVARGQTIVVLEAMKMEHPLKAAVTGVIDSINTAIGQQVKSKQVLATILTDAESERRE